jgi:hypothetical protein
MNLFQAIKDATVKIEPYIINGRLYKPFVYYEAISLKSHSDSRAGGRTIKKNGPCRIQLSGRELYMFPMDYGIICETYAKEGVDFIYPDGVMKPCEEQDEWGKKWL